MNLAAAWDAVHEALPARWRVGQPSFDPGAPRGDGYLGSYSVTAHGPTARGKAPRSVTGTGETEEAALRALEIASGAFRSLTAGQLDAMRRRLLAYVDGAETWAMENLGRRLNRDELGRVIGRYAGR